MRAFGELVSEAESADVTGWGFGWLEGRATEQRPPWGYARLLADRLARVRTALDIDTGGGEVVAEAPALPPRTCVTESWPPNAEAARFLTQATYKLTPSVMLGANYGQSRQEQSDFDKTDTTISQIKNQEAAVATVTYNLNKFTQFIAEYSYAQNTWHDGANQHSNQFALGTMFYW